MPLDLTPLTNVLDAAGCEYVLKSAPGYHNAIRRWARNAEEQALLVVFPKTEGDISNTVRFCVKNSISLAICGGGTSASGSSSAKGGIVLDLSKHFNRVTVNQDFNSVRIEGGATCKAVDAECLKSGLAVVGPAVDIIGAVGFFLGGGFGWLTGRLGLAVDHLLQANVVLASGAVVKCSPENESDLFWAIRGSGCNFGVITWIEIKAQTIPSDLWGGTLDYPLSALEVVVQALQDWFPEADSDNEAATLTSSNSHNHNFGDSELWIRVTIFFVGLEDQGRARFQRFFDCRPRADNTGRRSYPEFNALRYSSTEWGHNYLNTGFVITTNRLTPGSVRELANEGASMLRDQPRFDLTMHSQFLPWGKVRQMPPDATPVSPATRKDGGFLSLMLKWDDDDRAGEASDFIKEFRKFCFRTLYGHDQGTVQDPVKHYFGDNYPRLQCLKERYDPHSLFDKWYPISPGSS